MNKTRNIELSWVNKNGLEWVKHTWHKKKKMFSKWRMCSLSDEMWGYLYICIYLCMLWHPYILSYRYHQPDNKIIHTTTLLCMYYYVVFRNAMHGIIYDDGTCWNTRFNIRTCGFAWLIIKLLSQGTLKYHTTRLCMVDSVGAHGGFWRKGMFHIWFAPEMYKCMTLIKEMTSMTRLY